jgi:hypothetical protein
MCCNLIGKNGLFQQMKWEKLDFPVDENDL